MRLFLLFLAVPLIEIALFVQIGGAIGLGWTLAIVILTAILGTALVRSQGTVVLGQVRGSFEELKDPTEPLAHGAMILFSGALLLTPGFFTDAVGFALLVPGIRSVVFKFVRSRINVEQVQFGSRASGFSPHRQGYSPPPGGPTVIDGEFEEIETPKASNGPSGWTRH